MNIFFALFAICCLAVVAKARPGYSHGSDRLEGIPDLESFSNIKYPKYDILGLGEYSEGHLPADEIHVTKHVTVKEPQPYPVKVPVPHPYPVPVAKPYPVVETKYVKVPHAVPYEIVKKVPVTVEVPKPYPVPVHSGGGDSWHAGSGNVGQVESYAVQEQGNDVGNLGGGDHISSYEAQGYGGADQGGQGDWQPSGQQEEGH
ncbi:uncharacterized protein LOC108903660 [Anoplophora glabripennis]|uniref:uncharacterized protein LOC108903660 n=1 Tax=Anoplophora glabripennis TaxID=217634 RepID=UPI000873AFD7|nr:uncharacterized protein LOC108903660 [Anoplophora glabripennis]